MSTTATADTATIVSGGWRRPDLTVQGWQNLVLSIVGVIVLAGAVAGAVLLSRTGELSRELIDDIQPARVAAYQLQGALRDQETAVRGYVIAAASQFLGPYNDGLQAEIAAAQDIRHLVGDRPDVIADLDAIERASAAWRTTYAQPLIASVTPGVPTVVSSETVERGKAEFDRLRVLFDAQNQDLAMARADHVRELAHTRNLRNSVLAGLFAVFFTTAILLALLMRRAVTRPLDALAAACRRITEGNFSEGILPRGPKDLRGMAIDVDNMRRRIVDELDTSQSARKRLAEQAQVLDQQAAELRRSNAELEQFASVASHDLQEPLRKVASFCQLLEKRYGDKLDARGVEYVGFAVDGAKRMQMLINDLLALSRVGRPGATYTTVELDSALDAALVNLTAAIEESSVEIVRSRRLPSVRGERTQLVMLWQNLIANAVKFRRDDRAPRIIIDCQHSSGDRDNEWRLSVSDNGIGIDEEFADKVFVIFQRLHGRDAYTGTGIGLALCKKIVEQHGGTIWVDTSYTEGTRFCFTMPTAAEQTPADILEGTH
ncbi:MAG TPA: ATP-binding protein [Mycobacterium sp.]|nr:ATP-binding protein [Mycobacterium sp.]